MSPLRETFSRVIAILIVVSGGGLVCCPLAFKIVWAYPNGGPVKLALNAGVVVLSTAIMMCLENFFAARRRTRESPRGFEVLPAQPADRTNDTP